MTDIRFRLRVLVTVLGFTLALGVGNFMVLEGLTVDYLRYLRGNFAYLYSLAVRTNPFVESASPVVR